MSVFLLILCVCVVLPVVMNQSLASPAEKLVSVSMCFIYVVTHVGSQVLCT